MDMVNKLLQGACDLHIHSGPGLLKRSLTHMEAAQHAYDAGMRAIVLKDQHSCTHNLPATMMECMNIERPFNVYGSVVLNSTAGGLNPCIVETAIEYGAKVIWMPTLSAAFHRQYHAGLSAVNAASLPKVSSKLKFDESQILLDGDNKLKQEVIDIIKLASDADVILANGHVSQLETDLVIEKAKELGCKKIVIDHPELHLKMSIDKMKEYAKAGVYLEHVLAIIYSNKSSHEYIYEMIQATGVEYTLISSDLGQLGRPLPIDGMKNFIKAMLELGMSEEDLETLLKKNPQKLLNIVD